MIESWTFSDSAAMSSPEAVLERLRARVAGGQLETWLTSSAGRLLVVVTNSERAMVMLLDSADDPGEHAVDPGAGGRSKGFILANGQHDEYPNEDTVPLEDAFRIVDHIVASGSPPADAAWLVDR
ncbi:MULTISPECIES: hypothetical protein [unclassified Streptomyces]|uniref:hypothetical protein n=1 Tax=unclassified Streptomyces TaxID=2593676 RepID=UPI002E1659E5|nr:hypothetical protein OG466_40515 [Streptomyces sp. NBC_01240]